jgi:hypothetical protein
MAIEKKLLKWVVGSTTYALNMPSVYGSAIETKLGYSDVGDSDTGLTLLDSITSAIKLGVLLRCTFRVATASDGIKSVRGLVPNDEPNRRLQTCKGTALSRQVHVAGTAASTADAVGTVSSASVRTRTKIQY